MLAICRCMGPAHQNNLTEFAAKHDLNVFVENHGGLSFNGAWLAEVMKTVGHSRCGMLPGLGNFHLPAEAAIRAVSL
jgi:hypothetical protein